MSSINPQVAVGASSFAAWLVYKNFEPENLLAHLILLIILPGVIVQQSSPQFSSWTSAALAIYISFWATLFVLIVAYRISLFHPLAKFPGPLMCKITKWTLALEYGKGQARDYFIQLHEKYGDVVRIGPNELSFKTADAVAPILTNKPLPKGPYYSPRIQNGVAQLDGMRDFAEHTQRRKLWNKSVTPAAIKEYSEMLKDVVRDFVTALEKRQGEVLDLSAWLGYMAFEFMGHMARSFGLLKAGKDEDGLIKAVDDGTGAIAVIAHVPWVLSFLAVLPAAGAMKILMTFTRKVSQERIKSGSTSRDLYHYLIAEDEPEENRPSKESATADGMLSVIAGSDTSATAMSHLFYFLLRNPACMERLQKEIDVTFHEDHELEDYSKMGDMPYLNACINEALRLYPPVQCGLQRRVEKGSGGRMIGSHFVPEDTQVSAHLPLLQRDPRYFYPLPDQFWPDRFLSQETYTLPSGDTIRQDQLILERNLFQPFSTGPQNCAGRAIAQQEMRAVVCAILKKFNVEKAEGFDLNTWEKNVADYYVSHRGRLMVKLTARRP
ncbi:hypothetical protein EIP91_011789 [Steccherinum ochraceum]|uniref:Cytochrome P450 67 n=1 Tax=Steccherinum ochraceum TaxID=92696 RepID=A0A4R0RP84_9APHY|nr:hypothetical protein EIP91_011789 [Steccherinum ochraceum]